MTKIEETVTIKRVANGWLVHGKGAADVLHVAVTPDALADYVTEWASGFVDQPHAPNGASAKHANA